MAGISQANIRLVGSHAGVEIGQDGPSQMALEDLASMRAIHSSTVLYPSDPNQTAKLVKLMADEPGIVYMRTTRGAYPTIYGPADTFKIGASLGLTGYAAVTDRAWRDGLMVAVDGPAGDYKERLRRAIQQINPDLPVRTVNTLQEQIEQSLWQRRAAASERAMVVCCTLMLVALPPPVGRCPVARRNKTLSE